MVAALDERVGAVEEALTAHIAGAGRRQQEINRLRGDLDRARWRVRFGKGR